MVPGADCCNTDWVCSSPERTLVAHSVEFGSAKQGSLLITGVVATSLTDAIAGEEGGGGGAGGDVRNDKVILAPALARPVSVSFAESANPWAKDSKDGDPANSTCSTSETPVTFDSVSFTSRMEAIGETAMSNVGAKGGCKDAGK